MAKVKRNSTSNFLFPKATAFFALLTFIFVNILSPSYAETGQASSPRHGVVSHVNPIEMIGSLLRQAQDGEQSRTVTLPEGLGTIQEIYAPSTKLQEPRQNRKDLLGRGAWSLEQSLVVFVQDAHANYDSASRIRKLIGFFQHQYGLPLVLLEGGEGPLDSLFFKSFPERELKEKILEEYLKAGELSGGELASILHTEYETDYYGVDRQSVYNKNKEAFLSALEKEKEITRLLGEIESNLNQSAVSISSPGKDFIEKYKAFHRESLDLLDYVKFLVRAYRNSVFVYRHCEPAQISRLPNHKGGKLAGESKAKQSGLKSDCFVAETAPRNDMQRGTRLDEFPELEKILTIETKKIFPSPLPLPLEGGEEKGEGVKSPTDLDVLASRWIFRIKTHLLPKLNLQASKKMNQMIQSYQTGGIDQGTFVKQMEDLAAEKGFSLTIPKALKPAAQQARTLASIRGTKIFEELKKLEENLMNTLPQSETERNILQDFAYLTLLERFEALELLREDWQLLSNCEGRIQDCGFRSLQASQRTPSPFPLPLGGGEDKGEGDEFASDLPNTAFDRLNALFTDHFKFYQLARRRDQALFENSVALMEKKKAKVALIVAGGFHAEGITQQLRDSEIPFLMITPKIDHIDDGDRARYVNAIQGKRSFMKYFKGSLWGALAQDYAAKVAILIGEVGADPRVRPVGGLGQARRPASTLLLKRWRDNIIQESLAEGRITEAGSYTKYVDALAQALRKGEDLPPRKGDRSNPRPVPFSEELRQKIERELDSFLSVYFDKLKSQVRRKLEIFDQGLKEIWKSGEVTPHSVGKIFERMNALPGSHLAADLALIKDAPRIQGRLSGIKGDRLPSTGFSSRSEVRKVEGALKELLQPLIQAGVFQGTEIQGKRVFKEWTEEGGYRVALKARGQLHKGKDKPPRLFLGVRVFGPNDRALASFTLFAVKEGYVLEISRRQNKAGQQLPVPETVNRLLSHLSAKFLPEEKPFGPFYPRTFEQIESRLASFWREELEDEKRSHLTRFTAVLHKIKGEENVEINPRYLEHFLVNVLSLKLFSYINTSYRLYEGFKARGFDIGAKYLKFRTTLMPLPAFIKLLKGMKKVKGLDAKLKALIQERNVEGVLTDLGITEVAYINRSYRLYDRLVKDGYDPIQDLEINGINVAKTKLLAREDLPRKTIETMLSHLRSEVRQSTRARTRAIKGGVFFAGANRDREELIKWPQSPKLEQGRSFSTPFSYRVKEDSNTYKQKAYQKKPNPKINRQFLEEMARKSDGQNRFPQIGDVAGNKFSRGFIEGNRITQGLALLPESLRGNIFKVNKNIYNNKHRSEARHQPDGGQVRLPARQTEGGPAGQAGAVGRREFLRWAIGVLYGVGSSSALSKAQAEEIDRQIRIKIQELNQTEFYLDNKISELVQAVIDLTKIEKGKYKEKVVAALAEVLKDKKADGRARQGALQALGEIKEVSRYIVQTIIGIVKDKKENILTRNRAALALGKIDEPYAVGPILDLALEDQKVSNERAIEALKSISGGESVSALIRLTEKSMEDYKRHELAAGVTHDGFEALAGKDSDKALDFVISVMRNNETEKHRRVAATYLYKSKSQRAFLALQEVLEDRKEAARVKLAAAGALLMIARDTRVPVEKRRAIRHQVDQYLVSVLKSKANELFRQMAAGLLGQTENDFAVDALLEIIKNSQEVHSVREIVYDALWNIQNEVLRKVLNLTGEISQDRLRKVKESRESYKKEKAEKPSRSEVRTDKIKRTKSDPRTTPSENLRIFNTVKTKLMEAGTPLPEETEKEVLDILISSSRAYSLRAILNLLRAVTLPLFSDDAVEALKEMAGIPGIEKAMNSFILHRLHPTSGDLDNARGALREIVAAKQLVDSVYEEPPGQATVYEVLALGDPVESDLIGMADDVTFIAEIKDPRPGARPETFIRHHVLDYQVRRYFREIQKSRPAAPLRAISKIQIDGREIPGPSRILYVVNGTLAVSRDLKDLSAEIRRLFYKRIQQILPQLSEEQIKRYFRIVFIVSSPILTRKGEERQRLSRRPSLYPNENFHRELTLLYRKQSEVSHNAGVGQKQTATTKVTSVVEMIEKVRGWLGKEAYKAIVDKGGYAALSAAYYQYLQEHTTRQPPPNSRSEVRSEQEDPIRRKVDLIIQAIKALREENPEEKFSIKLIVGKMKEQGANARTVRGLLKWLQEYEDRDPRIRTLLQESIETNMSKIKDNGLLRRVRGFLRQLASEDEARFQNLTLAELRKQMGYEESKSLKTRWDNWVLRVDFDFESEKNRIKPSEQKVEPSTAQKPSSEARVSRPRVEKRQESPEPALQIKFEKGQRVELVSAEEGIKPGERGEIISTFEVQVGGKPNQILRVKFESGQEHVFSLPEESEKLQPLRSEVRAGELPKRLARFRPALLGIFNQVDRALSPESKRLLTLHTVWHLVAQKFKTHSSLAAYRNSYKDTILRAVKKNLRTEIQERGYPEQLPETELEPEQIRIGLLKLAEYDPLLKISFQGNQEENKTQLSLLLFRLILPEDYLESVPVEAYRSPYPSSWLMILDQNHPDNYLIFQARADGSLKLRYSSGVQTHIIPKDFERRMTLVMLPNYEAFQAFDQRIPKPQRVRKPKKGRYPFNGIGFASFVITVNFSDPDSVQAVRPKSQRFARYLTSDFIFKDKNNGTPILTLTASKKGTLDIRGLSLKSSDGRPYPFRIKKMEEGTKAINVSRLVDMIRTGEMKKRLRPHALQLEIDPRQIDLERILPPRYTSKGKPNRLSNYALAVDRTDPQAPYYFYTAGFIKGPPSVTSLRSEVRSTPQLEEPELLRSGQGAELKDGGLSKGQRPASKSEVRVGRMQNPAVFERREMLYGILEEAEKKLRDHRNLEVKRYRKYSETQIKRSKLREVGNALRQFTDLNYLLTGSSRHDGLAALTDALERVRIDGVTLNEIWNRERVTEEYESSLTRIYQEARQRITDQFLGIEAGSPRPFWVRDDKDLREIIHRQLRVGFGLSDHQPLPLARELDERINSREILKILEEAGIASGDRYVVRHSYLSPEVRAIPSNEALAQAKKIVATLQNLKENHVIRLELSQDIAAFVRDKDEAAEFGELLKTAVNLALLNEHIHIEITNAGLVRKDIHRLLARQISEIKETSPFEKNRLLRQLGVELPVLVDIPNVLLTAKVSRADQQSRTFDLATFSNGESVRYSGEGKVPLYSILLTGATLLKEQEIVQLAKQEDAYRWRDSRNARELTAALRFVLAQAAQEAFTRAA